MRQRIIAGHPDQPETDDQHAGYRSATYRGFKRFGQTGASRFGCAHVGFDRNKHADVAGKTRKQRADQKTESNLPAEAGDKPKNDRER